jgi:hypothetical protein
MDSISATQAANDLGTSVPRVLRAAGRLRLRTQPGRLDLSPSQYRKLKRELGVTPRVPGLSRTEVKVLAALKRAPFGLVSARAVSSRAGISPTAASRALTSLKSKRLARHDPAVVALGRARKVELWRANVLHPRWSELTGSIDRVEFPHRPSSESPRRSSRVPARLRHIFWNVDPSELDSEDAGPLIARRLLRSEDPEGLAWGATHLDGKDWREAARARGLDPAVRAMALNLANHGRRP